MRKSLIMGTKEDVRANIEANIRRQMALKEVERLSAQPVKKIVTFNHPCIK